MQVRSRQYLAQCAALSLALGSVALLGACKSKGNSTTDTAGGAIAPSAGATTAAGASTGAMAPPAASTALNDSSIVALLDEANAADSTSGAMALPKATRSDVKSFAKLMMGEHHALRVMGQQLAKAQHITPQAPANDPFAGPVKDEQNALSSATSGPAFDSTYIAKEVGIHRAVIDWAKTAEVEAQNKPLQKLIKSAAPILQKHLDRAEAIQKRLGKPAA